MGAIKFLFWFLFAVFICMIIFQIWVAYVKYRNTKSRYYINKFIKYIISLLNLKISPTERSEGYYQLGVNDIVLAYIYHKNNRLEIYSNVNDLLNHHHPLLFVVGTNLYAYIGDDVCCLDKAENNARYFSDYNFIMKNLKRPFRLTCECIAKHFEVVSFKRIELKENNEVNNNEEYADN